MTFDFSPLRHNTPTPPPFLFFLCWWLKEYPMEQRSPICWVELLSLRSLVYVKTPQSTFSWVMKSAIFPVLLSSSTGHTFSKQILSDLVGTCCALGRLARWAELERCSATWPTGLGVEITCISESSSLSARGEPCWTSQHSKSFTLSGSHSPCVSDNKT